MEGIFLYILIFIILFVVVANLVIVSKKRDKNSKLNYGDYEGRIKKYSLRIQFDVTDENAFFERGLAYLKSGNKKAALEDLQMAGKLGSEKAYEIIERHNLIKPTQNQIYARESQYVEEIIYSKSSEYLGAIKDYDKIIKSDPNNSIAYLMRAGIKELYHDHIGALDDLTSSLKNNNKNPEAYYKRGAIKIKLSDFQGAKRDLDTALSLGFKKAQKLLNNLPAN